MSASEVIDRLDVARRVYDALARLLSDGWIKGSVGVEVNGPCCAWGALYWECNRVAGCDSVRDIDLSHRAAQEILTTLNRSGAELGWWASLTGWNDAPERTFEDVVEAFERTIARLEAGSPAAEQP